MADVDAGDPHIAARDQVVGRGELPAERVRAGEQAQSAERGDRHENQHGRRDDRRAHVLALIGGMALPSGSVRCDSHRAGTGGA